MALEFKKKEAIVFGDLKVAPELNTELELRVRSLDLKTEAGVEEAKTILSSCFGENATKVKAFMDENMSAADLGLLQSYLVNGPTILSMLTKELTAELRGNNV